MVLSIDLTAEQQVRLEATARHLGLVPAECARQILDHHLARTPPGTVSGGPAVPDASDTGNLADLLGDYIGGMSLPDPTLSARTSEALGTYLAEKRREGHL